MKRELDLTKEDLEVVNGKVMISSEELAAAIQDNAINLNAEDEDESLVINILCH